MSFVWRDAVVGGSCLAIGFGVAAGLVRAEPPKPSKLPDVVLTARVAELERRADEQAKVRCLNVTTPRMDLAIFPVENLGRRSVPSAPAAELSRVSAPAPASPEETER